MRPGQFLGEGVMDPAVPQMPCGCIAHGIWSLPDGDIARECREHQAVVTDYDRDRVWPADAARIAAAVRRALP